MISEGSSLEPNQTTAKKRGLFQCIFTAIGGSALPIVQSPLAHNEEFAAYNYLNAQAKSVWRIRLDRAALHQRVLIKKMPRNVSLNNLKIFGNAVAVRWIKSKKVDMTSTPFVPHS